MFIRPRKDVTVVILTCNESANIDRCLSSVTWARAVVVVDSGSTDETEAIVNEYSNTTVVYNEFISHAQQWNFAVNMPAIQTPWILCLDADYQVPATFVAQIGETDLLEDVNAMSCSFDFYIQGRHVPGNLYGRKPVLFRQGTVEFIQKGHTQIAQVTGVQIDLPVHLRHDDRKPIDRWLNNQMRYAELEAQHIQLKEPSRRLSSNLRRWPRVSVFITAVYLMLFKGMIFKGRAGHLYLMQRVIAESLISMKVIEDKLGEPRRLSHVRSLRLALGRLHSRYCEDDSKSTACGFGPKTSVSAAIAFRSKAASLSVNHQRVIHHRKQPTNLESLTHVPRDDHQHTSNVHPFVKQSRRKRV